MNIPLPSHFVNPPDETLQKEKPRRPDGDFTVPAVGFASDFKALGYITFEKNKLDAKGIELLNELRALGIMKFTLA